MGNRKNGTRLGVQLSQTDQRENIETGEGLDLERWDMASQGSKRFVYQDE